MLELADMAESCHVDAECFHPKLMLSGVMLQCVCSCPVAFDNSSAPAPSVDGSSMADAGRRLLQADASEMMSGMTSGCGPVPTQYESFTQVS